MQAQSQKRHGYPGYPVFFPFGMDFVGINFAKNIAVLPFIKQFFLQRPRFVAPCWWGLSLFNNFMDKYCAT